MKDLLCETVKQGQSLFGICDAAQNHEIPFRLRKTKSEYECLYQGREFEELWYVAPYLFRCGETSEFLSWIVNEGWGCSWGIFFVASADLKRLADHLRRFVLVTTNEADKQFYFRFYDPRVLRTYLPTCSSDEAVDFFGPIRCFLTESGRTGELLKFTLNGTGTKQEAIRPKTIS